MLEIEALNIIIEIILASVPAKNIHGHQDTESNRQSIPLEVQLKCIANSLAKKYLSVPINDHLPSTTLAVYHKGKCVANDYAKHLKQLCYQNDTKNRLKKIHN